MATAQKFTTKLTPENLGTVTATITIDGVTHNVALVPRVSSNGNPMLFAVGKVTGDGSNPLANRYQLNFMLTLIDDSPEAQAARKAARK